MSTADTPLAIRLSESQRRRRDEFRRFVAEHVTPHADGWDRDGEMPRSAIEALAEAGYLGSLLPPEVGGAGLSAVDYGILTEEIARGCSSLRSLLTVHDMVCVALSRWGNAELKERYLPRLAEGSLLGAVAITEPEHGSDAKSVELAARRDGDEWVLDGKKCWITYGRVADLVLVLGRGEEGLTTFLVDTSKPGFSRRPVAVTGTRAAMIAELDFDGYRLPASHVVGRPGFGFTHVIATALDQGRYSVAWGAVGVCQASLDVSLAYAHEREQFGKPIFDHQLIRRLLTEMIADTQTARLFCCRAGTLRDEDDPGAIAETMLAKYVASRASVRVASNGVQVHGGHGVSEERPLMRFLRDAKVLEIIEGSSQLMQLMLPRYPLPEL